jgi:hypothetical protein
LTFKGDPLVHRNTFDGNDLGLGRAEFQGFLAIFLEVIPEGRFAAVHSDFADFFHYLPPFLSFTNADTNGWRSATQGNCIESESIRIEIIFTRMLGDVNGKIADPVLCQLRRAHPLMASNSPI